MPTERQYIAYVTTNGNVLNMRSGPGTSYKIILEIPNGAKLIVLGRVESWSRARYTDANGQTTDGWVNNKYLRFTDLEPSHSPPPLLYATVVTRYDPLNMRAKPDANAAIITKVPKGAEVATLARGVNWVQCEYAGYIGYCSAQYLKFEQDSSFVPALASEGAPEPPEDARAVTDLLPDGAAFDGGYELLALAYNEPVDMRALPDGDYVTVAGVVQSVRPGEEVALRDTYIAEPMPERRWILVQTRGGVMGYLPEDLFGRDEVLTYDSDPLEWGEIVEE